jgi:hypothetical protein
MSTSIAELLLLSSSHRLTMTHASTDLLYVVGPNAKAQAKEKSFASSFIDYSKLNKLQSFLLNQFQHPQSVSSKADIVAMV